MGEDSEESQGRTARWGVGGVVWRLGECGRYWPGGGRGGSRLDGVVSPGVSRTRLDESQRIGRQAHITRAAPRAVVAAIELIAIFPEAWAVT